MYFIMVLQKGNKIHADTYRIHFTNIKMDSCILIPFKVLMVQYEEIQIKKEVTLIIIRIIKSLKIK